MRLRRPYSRPFDVDSIRSSTIGTSSDVVLDVNVGTSLWTCEPMSALIPPRATHDLKDLEFANRPFPPLLAGADDTYRVSPSTEYETDDDVKNPRVRVARLEGARRASKRIANT
jgi:hypothetical protein